MKKWNICFFFFLNKPSACLSAGFRELKISVLFPHLNCTAFFFSIAPFVPSKTKGLFLTKVLYTERLFLMNGSKNCLIAESTLASLSDVLSSQLFIRDKQENLWYFYALLGNSHLLSSTIIKTDVH